MNIYISDNNISKIIGGNAGTGGYGDGSGGKGGIGAGIYLLNNQNKKDLIGKGILVCTDLINDPNILETINIKKSEINNNG